MPDAGQYAGDDRLDTSLVGVQAIGLIEAGVGGDTIEKKRIEQRTMLGREAGVDRIEGLLILRPEVARRRHAGQQHRQFSFGQLATALGCIAIVSSLGTFIAIRSYSEPRTDDFTTRSAATQTTFEKVLSKIGLMETPQQARDRRHKEQQVAIEYWNARVQTRRIQWDRATRDAFDRNLQVIDESVSEYTTILNQDPGDELSGEMLDTVLSDKMNLLRDFSDL